MTLAKWVGLGAIGLFVIVWFAGESNHGVQNKRVLAGEHNASAIVHSTNNEELRYLTAKMSQLTEQNKKVIEQNNYLKNKINKTGNSKLYAEQEKMQALIDEQKSKLHDLSNRIKTIKNHQDQTVSPGGKYPLNGKNAIDNKAHMITVVNDMSAGDVRPSDNNKQVGYKPILKTAMQNNNSIGYNQSRSKSKPSSIPYFTIPANATLADVVLQSDILAEVPVNNTLLQPAFKFKAIVGRRELLASNGITLPPNLSGIVFEGYSVGNMAMSCARGYITRMLFTWRDGSFIVVGSKENGTNLNPQDALGYISTPYGNPCLPGKYISDAGKVLASISAIGGISGGAKAFAQSQTTTSISPYQSFSQVTGNAFKYMGGKMVGTGADKALDWYTSRVNGVFDVVYIPSSFGRQLTHVVVNITKTIPIDKKLHGRKINYEHGNQNSVASGELD